MGVKSKTGYGTNKFSDYKLQMNKYWYFSAPPPLNQLSEHELTLRDTGQ